MTSLCLKFDLWYDLNNQGIQSLSTGHVHVQISGLYYEGNRIYASFSIIEGKMQGNQIEIWSIQTTLLEIS